MKHTQQQGHSISAMASAIFLLSALPIASSQAADTGWLSPENGDGNYTQWNNSALGTTNMGSFVNSAVGCDAPALATFWITGFNTARTSVEVTIPGTIPDGATIDSVDVQVCQSRAVSGADGASFQTFIRVDGSDTDAGSDIIAATPANSPAANTQNIPLGIVMTGGTFADLEVGTLKTNSIDFQRIHTLAARINYTIAGSTTAVSCTSPVVIGGDSTCTADVAPSAGATTPSGAVTWSTTDGGSFSSEVCIGGVGSLACSATFTPGGLGTATVTATYPGDMNMSGSDGSDDVQVDAVPPPVGPITPVPVFGPVGLLLSILGLGIVGGLRSRRKA